MLKSTPTDPLERGAFDFKKNDTVRKNASGKSGKLEESRQIHIIHNSILCYSIHQSQKILVLKEAANHPALPSIIKSAGLHSSLEDEVVFYHEEQWKRLLTTARYTQKKEGRTTSDQCLFVQLNIVDYA